MGVFSTNQHLKVFVSTASAAVVLDGNSGPTSAPAGLANGEITYMDGTTGTSGLTGSAAPPATGGYTIAYKDLNGIVFLSKIDAAEEVARTLSQAAVSRVNKVSQVAIGTPVEGDAFVVKLSVPNYGGLISAQDEVYFYGNYTAKPGDDANAVATGLRSSLGLALGRAPIPFATVSGATNLVIVTGVDQPYAQGQWDGRLVDFDLSISNPEAAWIGETVNTIPVNGAGIGKQVASMEEFYAGYNTSYKNRFADWPRMTPPLLAADVNASYTADTIIFRTNKYGAADESQRQTVICFYQV